MRYKYYLFDADETLFDFPRAQAAALQTTLREIGYAGDEVQLATFDAINARLWKLRETGGITQAALVVQRFAELLPQEPTAAIDRIAVRYVDLLTEQGHLYPDAERVVRALHGDGARLAIVTNGVARTQHGRIRRSGIAECFDALVISEEVGAFKPDPVMAITALERLGCTDSAQAVMVGDNPATDILCAQRAGIPSCWYNPQGLPCPCDIQPTHTIAQLADLLKQ